MNSIDLINDVLSAKRAWVKWHNPMSRRWYRAALRAYREARARDIEREMARGLENILT